VAVATEAVAVAAVVAAVATVEARAAAAVVGTEAYCQRIRLSSLATFTSG